ncbi:MAG TPA: hypothetical protein VN176_07915 [Verrucomicrobiae bacterium]|jgi:HEAT repeat protein|nr:hypothetical protein [Verrucomicrobiae bacterium]
MRRILLFVVLVGSSPLFAAFAQTDGTGSKFLESQVAGKVNEQEEQRYDSATNALNDGKYEAAASGFHQVAQMQGRRADAALYWYAYALNASGQKEKALAVIADLRKSYPTSKWLQEAGTKEIEIRASLHQQVNPESFSDEEEKITAINALIGTDPERAIPLLDKIIHGNYSPKMKDKALFVLAQSDSDKAQQILTSLAKTNNDPDLQKRAIRNIGLFGNSHNRGILKDIYNSSSDVGVKKSIFNAWMLCGDKPDVLDAAQHEKSPEMRKEAIHYLGLMGGRAEIRQLYKQNDDADTKTALLHAMGLGGDAQGIFEIAKSDNDPEIRKNAIRDLGLFGGAEGSEMLTTIYTASSSDMESKKEVINALFLHGAAKEMVALARKETNPELKESWLQKLSLMRSPEITDYMMEILNK